MLKIKIYSIIAFILCSTTAMAQLPNEKFGKPSNIEWDYVGWSKSSANADAIVLYKSMTASYKLSAQFFTISDSFTDLDYSALQCIGNNQIDDSSILINYEVNQRTKILKPEGAKYANIDIIYYSPKNAIYNTDELFDIKVRVFTRNEKGKVEKQNINTSSFVKDRLDDNFMVMHVAVPDVKAGSIIEYQYKITSPRAAYIYDWSFQECIPVVCSKFDINIPAVLQFDMNVPIDNHVKSKVVLDRVSYDSNRADMKKAASCTANHYTIVGNNILPEGYPLDGNVDAREKVIANFTSKLKEPKIELPVVLPQGCTHLKIKNL